MTIPINTYDSNCIGDAIFAIEDTGLDCRIVKIAEGMSHFNTSSTLQTLPMLGTSCVYQTDDSNGANALLALIGLFLARHLGFGARNRPDQE